MFSSTSEWASPFLNVSARILSACFQFHPLCFFLSLSVSLSVCLLVCSSIHLYVWLLVCPSVNLSFCQSVLHFIPRKCRPLWYFLSLSVCLSVYHFIPTNVVRYAFYMSVCLSVYHFIPTNVVRCAFSLSVCLSVCVLFHPQKSCSVSFLIVKFVFLYVGMSVSCRMQITVLNQPCL